ncbi:phosphatidate cytidylyltransferase [Novosphingobium piscinae]|uniref:Phosphatidate cytidylyltransferase n=1 Tax=Novosphingobium piscinae TaxID=1507448 RepID=A0A7X1FX23_9SPHN|nr:phosphatidate cytidylyltransferase [Novosphingobium piscinae]MBC2668585.1 phosphatidate cytidylyltransferase [Novosphingobium piscinae]
MAEPSPAKRSDLPVRTASAMVMLAVAGTALWLGGVVWAVFVGLVAAGVLLEWSRLVLAFVPGVPGRLLWHLGGLGYVGLATASLLVLRLVYGVYPVLVALGVVIAVDVWAYFFGRRFGGPKIAPSISPSKTWSGLAGGILGAMLVMYLTHQDDWRFALSGVPIAVVAQAGDFFESWMKRRAGVKDSSHLIPGHGGLFDRLDGLLAVLFVVGLSGAIGGLA